ncbi:MAG: NUDIX domain-containing protein, partial [Bacteroidota bacterium]
MQLFIYDIPVLITTFEKRPDISAAHLIDAKWQTLRYHDFEGHIVLITTKAEQAKEIVLAIAKREIKDLQSLVILVENIKAVKERLKTYFTFIKAAGGVVTHQEKMLFIYRKKRWDLPKGKVDKGEEVSQAALREIKEECNVTAQIVQKIATTWHNYQQGKAHVLKKTVWYWMTTTTTESLKPQLEEDIEEVVFLSKREVSEKMKGT